MLLLACLAAGEAMGTDAALKAEINELRATTEALLRTVQTQSEQIRQLSEVLKERGAPATVERDKASDEAKRPGRRLQADTAVEPAMLLMDNVTITGAGSKLGVDGSLGVGTNSPGFKIDVESAATSGAAMAIRGNVESGGWSGIQFGDDGATSYAKGLMAFEGTDATARGKMHLCLDNEQGPANANLNDAKLTIDYTGKVGIGTRNPSTNVHLYTGSDAYVRIQTVNTGNAAVQFANKMDEVQFTMGYRDGAGSGSVFVAQSAGLDQQRRLSIRNAISDSHPHRVGGTSFVVTFPAASAPAGTGEYFQNGAQTTPDGSHLNLPMAFSGVVRSFVCYVNSGPDADEGSASCSGSWCNQKGTADVCVTKNGVNVLCLPQFGGGAEYRHKAYTGESSADASYLYGVGDRIGVRITLVNAYPSWYNCAVGFELSI
jgi:hypothetical protein